MEKLIIDNIKTIMNVSKKDIKDLQRFERGMSNYTYFFMVNNEKYVIRVIGKGASKYIDYYNELNVILLLANKNLTSELIYFDPITGTKIAKFIDGSIYDFTKNNEHTDLINSLKKLHSIKNAHISNYQLVDRLNKYESFINNGVLDSNYLKLKEWWVKLYLEVYSKYPVVLCHNDLQDANIIKTNNDVMFIDFEYAAYNDLFYDLASFQENSYLVFEEYFGKKCDDEAKKHLDFYKIYQALQWHLVASYKDSIGFSKETNYDFNELKNYFINYAQDLFNLIESRGDKE